MFVGDAPDPEVADAPRAAVDHSFRVQRKVCANDTPVLAQKVAVIGLLDIPGRGHRPMPIGRGHSRAHLAVQELRHSRMSASVIGLTSTERTSGMALQYRSPMDSNALSATITQASGASWSDGQQTQSPSTSAML